MSQFNKHQFRAHLAAQRPVDTRSDVEKAMDDGGQLVMFAPGQELKKAAKVSSHEREEVEPDDDDTEFDYRYETDDELWNRKLNEAHDYDLTGSVWREGVRRPVRLSPSGEVRNGYHRIAAADWADDRPGDRQTLVPLSWDDKEGQTMGSVGEPDLPKDPEGAEEWELYDDEGNYTGVDPYHGLPHHRDLYGEF